MLGVHTKPRHISVCTLIAISQWPLWSRNRCCHWDLHPGRLDLVNWAVNDWWEQTCPQSWKVGRRVAWLFGPPKEHLGPKPEIYYASFHAETGFPEITCTTICWLHFDLQTKRLWSYRPVKDDMLLTCGSDAGWGAGPHDRVGGSWLKQRRIFWNSGGITPKNTSTEQFQVSWFSVVVAVVLVVPVVTVVVPVVTVVVVVVVVVVVLIELVVGTEKLLSIFARWNMLRLENCEDRWSCRLCSYPAPKLRCHFVDAPK